MYPSTGQTAGRGGPSEPQVADCYQREVDARPSGEQMTTSVKMYITNHETEQKKPLSHLTFQRFKNFEVYLW